MAHEEWFKGGTLLGEGQGPASPGKDDFEGGGETKSDQTRGKGKRGSNLTNKTEAAVGLDHGVGGNCGCWKG